MTNISTLTTLADRHEAIGIDAAHFRYNVEDGARAHHHLATAHYLRLLIARREAEEKQAADSASSLKQRGVERRY